MSGREKPLILQNGMPIPQAYDEDLGDWTEYSTEHIKAIKAELALVKAELQTIKANQLSGDQKVQLSGTIVVLSESSSSVSVTAGSWFDVIPSQKLSSDIKTIRVNFRWQTANHPCTVRTQSFLEGFVIGEKIVEFNDPYGIGLYVEFPRMGEEISISVRNDASYDINVRRFQVLGVR